MPINIRRYIPTDVDSTSISSLFRFVSSDLKQKEYKGEVVCLITLVQSKDFLADKAIKFVWDSIRDTYLMSDSGSIVEDVKKSIAAGRKKVVELVKNDKEIETKGVDLSFCLVVIKGMNAYLGIFGEEELFLFKNKSFVNVGKILNDNKASAASMALSDKDIVLMGTKGTVSAYIKDNDGERIARTFANYGDQLPSHEAIVALSREDIFKAFEEEAAIEQENRERERLRHEQADKASNLVINDNQSMSGEEVRVEILDTKEFKEKGDREPATKNHEDEREKIVGAYVQEIKERKIEKRAKDIKNNITQAYDKTVNILKTTGTKLAPIGSKVTPVFEKTRVSVSNLFTKLVLRFRDFLENSYGRKLWYRRFMSRVSTFKIANGSTSYGMKVDGYKQGKLRNRRVMIVVLVAGLIVFVIIGMRLSADAKASRDLHNFAVAQLNSAQSNIAEVEKNLTFDKTSAQSYVEQANADLEKLKDKKLNITDGNKYNQMKTKLQGLQDDLYLITPVAENSHNIELFYDSKAQIDSKSMPQDILIFKNDFQQEYIYITDPGTKAVYRINLNDKDLLKIPDKSNELDSPMYLDVGVKGIYVYDSVAGVLQSPFDTNGSNKNFVALSGLDKESLDIKDVREMAILTQTDSVYLLSPSDGTVYKSAKSGNGYSLPDEYIKADNFQNAQDLFADTSVYVISSDEAAINRFTYNYNTARFTAIKNSIVGLTPEITTAMAGYTGGSLDNEMYLFDKVNKRLVVLEKPRETKPDILHPNEFWLVKQIVYRGDRSDAWNDVKDIVVDAQENYAYILDGSRIWKVNLK